MGDIIAFANQKGGVGKTTLTVQAAFHYAVRRHQRVLVVDMDAQANSTSTMLAGEPLTSTHSEALFHPEEEIVIQTVQHGIDLIGSSRNDNAGYDAESLPIEAAGNPALHLQKIRDNYDKIFLDCPPSLGRRLLSALLAADFVVCPIKLSGYAVDGLTSLYETISAVQQQLRPDLAILGAIVNEFDGTASQTKSLNAVKEIVPGLAFEAKIKHRAPVDAASAGRPVWAVPNGMRAAAEFEAVFKEMDERIAQFRREAALHNRAS